MIEAWHVREALRSRFGSALVDQPGIWDRTASLLQRYAPYKDTFESLAAQLEDELRDVVDHGEQAVVQLLELRVCLEEVAPAHVPVLVLELVVLDGEVGEKGVELGLHGWILSVVSRWAEPLLGQFLVSGTIPDWSPIVNRNLS